LLHEFQSVFRILEVCAIKAALIIVGNKFAVLDEMIVKPLREFGFVKIGFYETLPVLEDFVFFFCGLELDGFRSESPGIIFESS
jgi:hypothetical protein